MTANSRYPFFLCQADGPQNSFDENIIFNKKILR